MITVDRRDLTLDSRTCVYGDLRYRQCKLIAYMFSTLGELCVSKAGCIWDRMLPSNLRSRVGRQTWSRLQPACLSFLDVVTRIDDFRPVRVHAIVGNFQKLAVIIQGFLRFTDRFGGTACVVKPVVTIGAKLQGCAVLRQSFGGAMK